MKWFLRVALLLALIAGTTNANEYAWREAENATTDTFNHHSWYQTGDTNFIVDKTLLSPGMPGGVAGDWRAHYASGSTPAYIEWNDINVTEGGSYTWWARVAPMTSAYQYSVDGGAAQSMDLSHQHEVLDVIRGGPSDIDNVHYVGWVRVGNINLTPGTHTLRITAVAYSGAVFGAVDCICLVNYPWTPTGALRPGGATNPDPTPGPSTWFPLHVAEDSFDANSIIDMRDLVASTTGIPAGVNGHVTRVDDHFELSGNPGVPVKFWGICATHPSYTSVFDQQARTYVKYRRQPGAPTPDVQRGGPEHERRRPGHLRQVVQGSQGQRHLQRLVRLLPGQRGRQPQLPAHQPERRFPDGPERRGGDRGPALERTARQREQPLPGRVRQLRGVVPGRPVELGEEPSPARQPLHRPGLLPGPGAGHRRGPERGQPLLALAAERPLLQR